MAFFRSYIAPFFIVLIFAIAMLAVSARIFLPSDLAAPAPIEEMEEPAIHSTDDSTDVSARGQPVGMVSAYPSMPLTAG